jgi:hypothetical protein
VSIRLQQKMKPGRAITRNGGTHESQLPNESCDIYRHHSGSDRATGRGCRIRNADDIVRVRGTIESVDGSTYVVKTRDGAEQKIALAPNAQVAGVVKASLADVKPGSFVGVTALAPPDGTQRALGR